VIERNLKALAFGERPSPDAIFRLEDAYLESVSLENATRRQSSRACANDDGIQFIHSEISDDPPRPHARTGSARRIEPYISSVSITGKASPSI